MSTRIPNLLTPRQLADTLKVCPVTLRRWTAAGRIPAIAIAPRVVRYDLDAVLHALHGSSSTPTQSASHVAQDAKGNAAK